MEAETVTVTDSSRRARRSSVVAVNQQLFEAIKKDVPLTPAAVLVYEAKIFATSVPLALLLFGVLAGCLWPLYSYGTEAIDVLIRPDVDYEMGPENWNGKGVEMDEDGNQRFKMEWYTQDHLPGGPYDAVEAEGFAKFPTPVTYIQTLYASLGWPAAALLCFLCATVKEESAEHANVWDGWRMFGFWTGFFVTGLVLMPMIYWSILPRMLGNILFVTTATVFIWWSRRKMQRAGGRLPRWVPSSIIMTVLLSIFNTRLISMFTSDTQLAISWLVWVVIAEILMMLTRKGIRTIDFNKTDARLIPLLLIFPMVCLNVLKKVPLLSIQHKGIILAINALSFVLEVVSRITVMRRDMFLDRCLWRENLRQPWIDPLHKQAYIHAEMLGEIFEFAFPIPLGAILYLVQFAPSGEPVPGSVVMLNVGLQIAQELLADFCAVFYKSSYLNTFYAVAWASFLGRTQVLLGLALVASVSGAQVSFMIGGQLRVALTEAGQYITLL